MVKINEPYIRIRGKTILSGKVKIAGAKNSALPAIVAACMSNDNVTLSNIPIHINDVKILIELLNASGANIKIIDENTIVCNGKDFIGGQLDESKCNKIRHSLLILGLSARWRKNVIIPMTGGCDLGNRKHDMHISALTQTFNDVKESNGIYLQPRKLITKSHIKIDFYYPTFGGTLNALYSAVALNKVHTVITNGAINPEVTDVVKLLNQMGANIKIKSHNEYHVYGVDKLRGTKYDIIPDRIIAATVIAATGITNGNVTIENFNSKYLKTEILTWRRCGLIIEQEDTNLHVRRNGMIKPVNITTQAYPGFHTDIQPLHAVLMLHADGQSEIKETILDGRFKYCDELIKTGAQINVINADFECVNGAQGQIAIIKGSTKAYTPNTLIATDIRGGAAVALQAMTIEGESFITNLYQLERGYESFVELFKSLGADIWRVS